LEGFDFHAAVTGLGRLLPVKENGQLQFNVIGDDGGGTVLRILSGHKVCILRAQAVVRCAGLTSRGENGLAGFDIFQIEIGAQEQVLPGDVSILADGDVALGDFGLQGELIDRVLRIVAGNGKQVQELELDLTAKLRARRGDGDLGQGLADLLAVAALPVKRAKAAGAQGDKQNDRKTQQQAGMQNRLSGVAVI